MPIERSAVQVNRLVTYNPSTLRDDISLIKLNSSVPLLSSVKPIQLPPASQASATYLGNILIVSGFGLTTTNQVSTTLQYTRVIGISKGECQNIYGSFITSNILCTRGYPNINQGSCSGKNSESNFKISWSFLFSLIFRGFRRWITFSKLVDDCRCCLFWSGSKLYCRFSSRFHKSCAIFKLDQRHN
jgi:Trypsin